MTEHMHVVIGIVIGVIGTFVLQEMLSNLETDEKNNTPTKED